MGFGNHVMGFGLWWEVRKNKGGRGELSILDPKHCFKFLKNEKEGNAIKKNGIIYIG